jgi:uncharacterized protein YjiS (DUF1127 family)
MSTYFNDAISSNEHHRRRSWRAGYQSDSWLRLINKLQRWTERSRRRAAFRDLADDPHLLGDIGLTQREAMHEASKPFWR